MQKTKVKRNSTVTLQYTFIGCREEDNKKMPETISKAQQKLDGMFAVPGSPIDIAVAYKEGIRDGDFGADISIRGNHASEISKVLLMFIDVLDKESFDGYLKTRDFVTLLMMLGGRKPR